MRSSAADPWLYAAIALPIAIAFAFLTPPFQSPDEVAHYWRASATARGVIIPDKVGGIPGAMIFADGRDLVAVTWMELAGKDLRYDWSKMKTASQLRPSDELVRITFPAFYTAVSYLPQSAALYVARVFHVRTLYAFYAGRVVNALAGVLLVMLAMRLLPEAAWIFGAAGLLPMFLYLGGTFSADVVTIGLAFCATAAAARMTRTYWLPLLGGLLSLAKPGYALLVFLRAAKWRERSERAVLISTFALVAACGWLASLHAKHGYYDLRPDVMTDAAAQGEVVKAAPLRFLRVVVDDYARNGMAYLDQIVGRLGWLDVPMPKLVLVMYAVMLLYAAWSLNIAVPPLMRAAAAFIVLATMLTISLADYLSWTTVGSSYIEGIQGRYFIPIVPAAMLALSATKLRCVPLVVLLIGAAGNGAALYAIAMRY